MDFSNLRPDEWARTDLTRWNFYIQLRMAYEDGRDHVRRRRGDKASADKNMSQLVERVTGKKR